MNRNALLLAVVVLAAVILWPTPAAAMHIPERQLPAPWAGLWFLAVAPFLFWGLRTIRRRQAAEPQYTALVAMVGSAIFVISCMAIPIPVAHSCSHPCGTGLGALLIGPGPTVVVASIALLLQALFLCHGGLTTLGANVFSMGVMGAFSAYFTFHLLRRMRVPIFPAAMAAGLISDWATYATCSFEVASALHQEVPLWTKFGIIVLLFVPTQVPLGILEGVITAGAYRFVLSRRPELLHPRLLGRSAVGEMS